MTPWSQWVIIPVTQSSGFFWYFWSDDYPGILTDSRPVTCEDGIQFFCLWFANASEN